MRCNRLSSRRWPSKPSSIFRDKMQRSPNLRNSPDSKVHKERASRRRESRTQAKPANPVRGKRVQSRRQIKSSNPFREWSQKSRLYRSNYSNWEPNLEHTEINPTRSAPAQKESG